MTPRTNLRARPLSVLTEIKNRGVQDVCIVVCDGLKGLPESIKTTC
jgi:putative transposase